MILDTILSLLVMWALQNNEMGVCQNPDVCLERSSVSSLCSLKQAVWLLCISVVSPVPVKWVLHPPKPPNLHFSMASPELWLAAWCYFSVAEFCSKFFSNKCNGFLCWKGQCERLQPFSDCIYWYFPMLTSLLITSLSCISLRGLLWGARGSLLNMSEPSDSAPFLEAALCS